MARRGVRGLAHQLGTWQARVCRTKKRLQGESSATAVSQALPFVEYDLHRQLMYKLKVVDTPSSM